jgi:hypothetical protein
MKNITVIKIQRNLPKTEPQKTEIFPLKEGPVKYRHLNYETSGLPRDCNFFFPLNVGFRYDQVPFKTGFTVQLMIKKICRACLYKTIVLQLGLQIKETSEPPH